MKKVLLMALAGWLSFAPLQGMAQARALGAEETEALVVAAAQAPALLEQSAGGCRTVWDNDTQQHKTVCFSPVGMGLAGGVMGGVLGSFYGVAGVVMGALGGAVVLGGLTAVAYSE
jgi:hypothetical protein